MPLAGSSDIFMLTLVIISEIMPYAKKSHNVRPRSHAESRAALCSVCLGKHEVRLAKADTEAMIQNLLNPNFTLLQENLPNGICKTCQRILSTHSKNPEKPDRGRKLPPSAFNQEFFKTAL